MVRKPDLQIPKVSMRRIDKPDGGDSSDSSSSSSVKEVGVQVQMQVQAGQTESVRQRIRRHWSEMSGKVLIPDQWGKEDLLKDWMDYSSFDALLAPSGVGVAREALVVEGRRASSQRLMKESRC